jgi:hypothetical protein
MIGFLTAVLGRQGEYRTSCFLSATIFPPNAFRGSTGY